MTVLREARPSFTGDGQCNRFRSTLRIARPRYRIVARPARHEDHYALWILLGHEQKPETYATERRHASSRKAFLSRKNRSRLTDGETPRNNFPCLPSAVAPRKQRAPHRESLFCVLYKSSPGSVISTFLRVRLNQIPGPAIAPRCGSFAEEGVQHGHFPPPG